MKRLLVVLMILAFATPLFARDLTGSYVSLIDPTAVAPGQTYTFEFYCWNNSPDVEWIMDIYICFPSDFTVHAGTQSWLPGPAWYWSTGNWIQQVVGTCAQWIDADGPYGELYDLEDVYFFVDATVPAGFAGGVIHWELQGDIWGNPPHFVEGDIDLGVTAVEEATWTSIKSMFR